MKKPIFLLIVLCLLLSACNSGKDSPNSGHGTPGNGNTDSPEPKDLPGIPRNLMATAGDRQVTLSWEAPSTVGASAISRYEYQYSTTSDSFGNTWTNVPSTGTTVTVSSLIAGTTYHFQVRAVNAQGVGTLSNVSQTPYDGLIDLETVCSDLVTTDSTLFGTGTVNNPFVLCLPAHLKLIGTDATYTLSANYVMGQDIDLNNESFTPIAGSFTGTLDGRDKKIMNLTINVSGHAALFLELGSGGSIKNLGIEEFDVTGSGRVGSLVAISYGTITSCYAVDSDEATDTEVSGGVDSRYVYVGGLVGYQFGGRITSSYATGNPEGGNGANGIGGLVGRQDSGNITSSYATGNPEGKNGSDYIGGLVGWQNDGSITSSYTTGSPNGGGDGDRVGGLVGYQFGGCITSSYTTGNPDGGGGRNGDFVGGLVGHQFGGSITSSYATGNPNGGQGANDLVGGLVGHQYNGSITSSYGFGTTVNGETSNTYGAPPSDVTSASALTQANSGDSDTNRWSTDAWDFGTSSQAPALKYVDSYTLGDHDNDVNTPETYAYTCTSNTAFLPSIDITCSTTPLPKQPGRLCTDSTDSTLLGTGAVNDPFVLCSPAHLKLIGTDATYTLSANYVMGQDIDLNNESFTPIAGSFTGTLDGRDKKIMNLTINVSGHAALFLELGSGGSIKNLGIGEFDVTGSGRVGSLVAISYGAITRCYAVDSDEATDAEVSGGASRYVGGLVGYQFSGSITSSYATGNPEGGSDADSIGGLVGRQDGGSITSSYATGNPEGGSGSDYIGGLVGELSSGNITSSYATGNPKGGSGSDYIGGLVGWKNGGSITSSYTAGSPDGGGGGDRVGGLVGYQFRGSITSSYTTGNPDGGGGRRGDFVGGLMGHQFGGSITSSYATGNPNGGEGDNDLVGGLVGHQYSGSITSSYGFGTTVNGETSNTYGALPSGVTSASTLTQANSGDPDTNRWSTDAWDFGTSSQAPTLKYVDSYILGDHDNDANTAETYAYTCTSNTAFLPPVSITCGTTLLPNQR